MDENVNLLSASEVEKVYFEKKIPTLKRMSALTKWCSWRNIVELAGHEKPEKDVIDKIKLLHISEDDWSKCSEKGDTTSALDYWKWVLDFLRVGGKYVDELTLQFSECDGDDEIRDACVPIKKQVLEDLPKMCMNLKAIRFTGTGLLFEKREECREFEKLATNDKCVTLEYCDIGFEMTETHIDKYLHVKFLSGSPLQSLSVFWEQLSCVRDSHVFSSVTQLRLGHFGSDHTNEEEFLDMICKLFPGMKTLRLFRSFCDIVENLPAFVNGVSNKIHLTSFGVDQSFYRFLSETDEVINTVSTVELNVKCYGQPTYVFLEIASNFKTLVIKEWNREKDPKLRVDIVTYVKNQKPSCMEVVLVECDGRKETITRE